MEWIVTDDIRRETWRRLFEFANIDLATDAIIARHGTPKDNSERQNYKKQAQQVRACVLQAKEYFDAAEASTLITSPNHAYYGAICLASMMMLVLGDGRSALDVLRRDSKNQHHGLQFSTGCNAKNAATGTVLIDETRVEILENGHFANWYQALPRIEQIHVIHRRRQFSSEHRSFLPIGGYEIPSFRSLVGRKIKIIDLLRYFPDLSAELYRARVDVSRSKVTHEVEINVPQGRQGHVWYVHGAATPAEREAVLAGFEIEARCAEFMTCEVDESTLRAIIRVTWNIREAVPIFRWPTPRDTMSRDTIYYADNVETPEFVDMYLVAYQLSMVSRYFPDIWMSCIESQCKAAKLIESAVELLKKKLPILALSTVTPGGVTISTHLEPWRP